MKRAHGKLLIIVAMFVTVSVLARPAAAEKTYKALDPRGTLIPVKRAPLTAARPANLKGKTIYFVDVQQDSRAVAKLISETLQKEIPDSKVKYIFQNTHHVYQPEVWKEVREKADAAVVGVAYCGLCASRLPPWTTDLEKAGVPSVYIYYEEHKEAVEKQRFKTGAPVRGVPLPRGIDLAAQATSVMGPIVASLTSPLTEEEQRTGMLEPPKPPRVAVSGTMEDLQEYFSDPIISDGLPVIVPTEERVAEMLKGTSHSPDEVIGKLGPEDLEFTVEKAAINAVMAGCRPEYLPVLLAILKTGQSASRSSRASTPMVLVSGPITREIGMNAGIYAMGPGNRANASLGRAFRLCQINLGGGVPGGNLQSKEGNPMMYSWCFAEEYENSPFPPFHTTKGFQPNESTVTVFDSGLIFLESWGDEGLKGLCQQLNVIPSPYSAGVVISPEFAREFFVKNGLKTREAVQKYLWENTKKPLGEWRDTRWLVNMKGRSVKYHAEKKGRKFWPLEYFSAPPETVVHTYAQPEDIHIMIATDGEVVIKLDDPVTASVDQWR